MPFPSYIHDAAAIDDRHVLVLRSNPDNLKPGFLERWDVITGKREFAVSAGAPLAHTLALRGAAAASGDTEGAIRIGNVADGTCSRVIDTAATRQQRSVGALAFLDDTRLLAASFDGVAIWDVTTGKKLRAIAASRYGVWDVAVTPDGSRFITACSDRTVRVSDASNGKCVGKFLVKGLPAHTRHGNAQDAHTATSVSVWPDGQRVAASYGDGTIRCW